MTARTRHLGGVNSPPPTTTPTKESLPPVKPLDSDFVVILDALLCALICVLGLVAVKQLRLDPLQIRQNKLKIQKRKIRQWRKLQRRNILQWRKLLSIRITAEKAKEGKDTTVGKMTELKDSAAGGARKAMDYLTEEKEETKQQEVETGEAAKEKTGETMGAAKEKYDEKKWATIPLFKSTCSLILQNSEVWDKFHACHSSGKFFKLNLTMESNSQAAESKLKNYDLETSILKLHIKELGEKVES